MTAFMFKLFGCALMGAGFGLLSAGYNFVPAVVHLLGLFLWHQGEHQR